MKIAVISDIHGNYKAYEACMEYLDRYPVEWIFFLGDYITDAPYPQKLLAMFYDTLAKRQCCFVRGNREQYIIDNEKQDKGWRRSSGTGTLLYTREHLKKEDISFFEQCKTVWIPQIEEIPRTTLCHGIPEDIRGNLGEEPHLLEEALRQAGRGYLFGGHSHKQEIRRTETGTYLNPGALGLAIDGVGKQAQFAIVHVEKGQYREEFLSIPYDVEGYLKDFEDSGIEDYGYIQVRSVKKTLLTGINYFYECIKLVTLLSGGLSTDKIPEKIWEEAARRLDL